MADTIDRIYNGHVMHLRLIPRRHQFRYRVFSVLLDLDRLDETVAGLRLLRHNRFGLMGFYNSDHGARDGGKLRDWADAQCADAGQPRPDRIRLLSFPRMLGYAFNPLSVYYCHAADGTLETVIYEVKNTFGDQVAYTLPAGLPTGGSFRQEQDKAMYVSPFIEMAQRYRFAHNAPDARLALRIRQAGPEGETLIATHTGNGAPLTDRALARAFVAHPLLSLRVIALIHWHALRLVLKGVKYNTYVDSPTAAAKTTNKPA